jgi:SOS-response transcriptional repressor LexA
MKKTSSPEAAKVAGLTPRQAEVYKLVLKFFAEHGYPPTYLDVAELDGKDNATALMAPVETLAKKGLVALPKDGRARGLEVPRLREAMKELAASLIDHPKYGASKTRPRKTGMPIQPGEPPTPRQAEQYRQILEFFAKHGHAPTLRDMVALGNLTSTSIVVCHLKALHKRGMVVMSKPPSKEKTTRGRARGLDIPKLRDATMALAAKMLKELE